MSSSLTLPNRSCGEQGHFLYSNTKCASKGKDEQVLTPVYEQASIHVIEHTSTSHWQ